MFSLMSNKDFAIYDLSTLTIISFHTIDEAIYLVTNSLRGGISWAHKSRIRALGLKRRG